MTRNWIYDDVQRLRKKYGTNDPFELLDAIHAQVVFSDAYPKDGLKGYCAVLLKTSWLAYTLMNCKVTCCMGLELCPVIRSTVEMVNCH